MLSDLQLVQSLSKPKLVSGAEITGPELASLIERMVAALNSRDIPTAGSILEHFNKDLIQKVTVFFKGSVAQCKGTVTQLAKLRIRLLI